MILSELFESVNVPQWSKVLKDNNGIAQYIAEQSPGYVDEEMIQDNFIGCYAELEILPIDSIREGHPKMDIATLPPIVVENGVIVDGNHRFRLARVKGLKEIPCYVVKSEADY